MSETPLVVLITGTSTGIGLATAVRLAADHRVVASLRKGKEGGLADAVRDAGVEMDAIELDVTDPAAVDDAVLDVIERHGRIDVLINNAGAAVMGSLEQLSDDELDRAFGVNFFGPARLTRAVLPHMRRQGSGRIISVSSVGGVVGQPFNDAYCAAKFALEGMMESLAPVVAKFGIHVSLIEPGPVASAFVDSARATNTITADPDDPYTPLLTAYLGRSSEVFSAAQTPEEVAEVIDSVMSDPEPRLRYQTSALSEAFAGLKIADLDGSAVLGMTSTWI